MMNLELLENHPKSISNTKRSVLFVHGMWHGAWCWEPYFLPYFEKLGYKAYALSLSNHGNSPKHKSLNRLRINDYVKDLKQVIDSLDEIPVLIGHSMGGFVVQKYLEDHHVPGAVLLASVPPYGVFGGTIAVMKFSPGAFLKANFTLNLKYIIDTPKKFKHLMLSENVKDEDVIKYQKMTNSESYLAYMDMLGMNLINTKKIKTPLLIIGAGKDKAVSPKSVKKTALIYGVKPVNFEEFGHNIMLEPEYEMVADLIDNWIKNI